ncbi:MAG: orotidine-5'-phosphate decarboxylase [Candidatus Kapabacteria bacterium]|nr:orotidine-5'-phosphate decarboxylase [Candidatus Kapabacteria bacterium]
MNAFEKLITASEKNKTLLCVGLDTDIDKIPSQFKGSLNGILDFNKAIIDATSDLVNSYKLNFAFYEQYGIEGMEILKKTIEHIPNHILKIADAKRGDIGNTSRSYAKAAFEAFACDAITVSPYMGEDSIKPFLEYKDKLTFVLCLTSNEGSNDFQRLSSNGKSLYISVMEKTMKWGSKEQVGYVVGATHPNDLKELREIAPENPFLIPGIGAQGGDLEATLKANNNAPAMINASRAVIYASSGLDFAEKARQKAIEYQMSM